MLTLALASRCILLLRLSTPWSRGVFDGWFGQSLGVTKKKLCCVSFVIAGRDVWVWVNCCLAHSTLESPEWWKMCLMNAQWQFLILSSTESTPCSAVRLTGALQQHLKLYLKANSAQSRSNWWCCAFQSICSLACGRPASVTTASTAPPTLFLSRFPNCGQECAAPVLCCALASSVYWCRWMWWGDL